MKIRRLASIKTAAEFKKYLRENNITLPFAEKTTALNTPYQLDGKTIGNRFAILPMEGWDCTPDGHPTDLVRRRWANFGRSGAKLIWGGVDDESRRILERVTLAELVDRTLVGYGRFEPDYTLTNCMMTFIEAEVDTETGKVSLVKVVNATDAGQIIDPQGLENQLNGCLGSGGIDSAIFEETRSQSSSRTGTAHGRRISCWRSPTFTRR